MAPDLLPAGTQLQLGVHHGNEQPPKRLNRRALLRGTIAATAVGMIPFGTAKAQTDTPPKRPPITIETKLKNGVYEWNGRVSNRVPNAGPRATSFLSAGLNSAVSRGFNGAKPFIRVFGRAAGIVGVASMVWDIASWGIGAYNGWLSGESEKWRVLNAVRGKPEDDWRLMPTNLRNQFKVPSGFDPNPPAPQPNDPPPPPVYNEPETFDYVSGPYIHWVQLTAALRVVATSVFTVHTKQTRYTAVRPAPTLTPTQRFGMSEQLMFHNQWVYSGGNVPSGLTVVVTQYRVLDEVPSGDAYERDWESVQMQLASLPQNTLISGNSLANTMNEMFMNSGDPALFEAISKTPFVGDDFPDVSLADVMEELPDLVEVDQDQPAIDPGTTPGGGTSIDWGIFTPPGFELPALEVPEVPTAQEIIDTLTNPLSALIPVPSNQPVACPSFPWLMGQQVTAHCPAVELAQPWMGNASKIAAQIAAFFIALRE